MRREEGVRGHVGVQVGHHRGQVRKHHATLQAVGKHGAEKASARAKLQHGCAAEAGGDFWVVLQEAEEAHARVPQA